MDNLTWILVADSSKARLFGIRKAKLFNKSFDHKDLAFIDEYHHENSRKKDSELTSDRLGGFGKGTFVEATDPKQHEAEIFSHELTKVLSSGHHQHHYRDVILVAPPAFMGLLNKNLSNEVNKVISLRIEKDYTGHDAKDLVNHLVGYL